ncbi:chemotaxis protein CheW [Photobacterium nomapromontoriensis]|uniref:chemotaxis protein CheW n=1 Tax=Photobacterium nomapromontoriensis TaxID=2910237 RepID=UPI003D0A49AB
MSDNSRLSGEQALDDYFFDLLVEPPLSETSLLDEDDLADTVVDVAELDESTIVIHDHIPAHLSEPPPEHDDSETEESEHSEECEERTKSDECDGPAPSAAPFDFGTLEVESEIDFQPDDGHYPAMAPLQLQPVMPPRASWVEDHQVDTAQYDLQRLLNQVSQLHAGSEPDPELTSQPVSDELVDEWQLVMAHEAEQCQQVASQLPLQDETVLTALDCAALSVVSEPTVVEAQAIVPDVVAALETQASAGLPPEDWQQEVVQDDAFQALFFDVNGVTFAVPLTELGGIHQLGEVSHLLGRPAWYLGLMTNREYQLDVVDTASWAMPEKLTSEDYRDGYQYVVMLGDSKWGLACNVLQGTELLTGQSVRWREKAGKRPWLAGMVKEKMCALIHVSELITMLNAGLDVNTKIRQS